MLATTAVSRPVWSRTVTATPTSATSRQGPKGQVGRARSGSRTRLTRADSAIRAKVVTTMRLAKVIAAA